jgi:hypothetical protein
LATYKYRKQKDPEKSELSKLAHTSERMRIKLTQLKNTYYFTSKAKTSQFLKKRAMMRKTS